MADIADRASIAIEREALDVLRRARAPQRAPNPTGNCADCGEEIEPLRLAAMPHACRCANCQRDREHQQRHFRSA